MATRGATMVVAQTPPKTPAAKITVNSTKTETPSPGTWKHPRMAEITRRRKAAVFDKSNVRRIAYNVFALVATLFIPGLLRAYASPVANLFTWSTNLLGWYGWLPMLVFRLLAVYNLVLAAMPLFREPDNLSDIPLTPSQRQLLGLDPGSGKPGTPQTEYVTPPRYQKSTSRSRSPASGRDSNNLRDSDRKDRFSPNASPLWAQTVRNENRRSSLGRESPLLGNRSGLRESFGESIGFVPSSPSPARGNASGLAVNSRWLYERRSSSGTWS